MPTGLYFVLKGTCLERKRLALPHSLGSGLVRFIRATVDPIKVAKSFEISTKKPKYCVATPEFFFHYLTTLFVNKVRKRFTISRHGFIEFPVDKYDPGLVVTCVPAGQLFLQRKPKKL
jgi:hypothetical protein